MEEETCKTSGNKPKRDKKGRLLPGNTANPDGRPSFSLVALLKEELQEIPEGEKETYAQLLIKKYLNLAIFEGDARLIIDIINRINGVPKQTIETNSQNKPPIALVEFIGGDPTEERKFDNYPEK